MRPEGGDQPASAGALRRGIHLIRHEWWARLAALLAMLAFVALLPIPWLVAKTPNPPGMAWRLDGRLQFNGHTIDPPGSWIGLTAGRPPVLAEVIYSWIDPDATGPRDMRNGSRFSSPAMAEPAAIAIGLIEAGVAIDVTTLIEARDPLIGGLPDRIAVSQVNGQTITSRNDWSLMIDGLGQHNEIVTAGGQVVVFEGRTFPYGRVNLMQSPTDLSVSLAGWGSMIPESWYRNLSLGRSHGLLLALAAYSDAAGVDLADGRVIAATGVIRGDGTVGRIGGLSAKARAADRAGADLMFYPRDQRCQEKEVMESLGGTSMRMVPVATLSEAIGVLQGDVELTTEDGDCAA
jgi:hypothetical protein